MWRKLVLIMGLSHYWFVQILGWPLNEVCSHNKPPWHDSKNGPWLLMNWSLHRKSNQQIDWVKTEPWQEQGEGVVVFLFHSVTIVLSVCPSVHLSVIISADNTVHSIEYPCLNPCTIFFFDRMKMEKKS